MITVIAHRLLDIPASLLLECVAAVCRPAEENPVGSAVFADRLVTYRPGNRPFPKFPGMNSIGKFPRSSPIENLPHKQRQQALLSWSGFVGDALRGNLDTAVGSSGRTFGLVSTQADPPKLDYSEKTGQPSQSLGPEQPIHLPRAVFGWWSAQAQIAQRHGPKPTAGC